MTSVASQYNSRWAAVKLMEGDKEVADRFKTLCGSDFKTIQDATDRGHIS